MEQKIYVCLNTLLNTTKRSFSASFFILLNEIHSQNIMLNENNINGQLSIVFVWHMGKKKIPMQSKYAIDDFLECYCMLKMENK